MKLIRFGELNKEKPGVCINGINYDVSGFIYDYDEKFFGNGGLPHLAWMVEQHKTMLPEVPAIVAKTIISARATKPKMFDRPFTSKSVE